MIDTLRKYTSFPLEQYAEPLKTYRALDVDGNDLVKIEANNWGTSWGRLFHGLRQAFEEDGSTGVKTVYRTGCTVTSIMDDGSKAKLELVSNGQQEDYAADLVVGADGASSTLRHTVEPDSKRSYAGYVVVRGTVPTPQLSERTRETFHQGGGFFFPEHGVHFVLYTVPNSDSDVASGTCLNWVWYQLKTETELSELMTGVNGTQYTYTLPMGSMREEIVQKLKQDAANGMPPQVTEVVQKTTSPFVQTVTDNMAGSNCFFEGRLLLVGDAAAGQRPHSASALTQASFHARLLRSLFLGTMSLREWSEETQQFSSVLVESGRELGQVLAFDQTSAHLKMQEFFKVFMGTQAKLNSMWTESITNDSEL